MSILVVDSSIVLGWLFTDEASPATDALGAEVNRSGALAPTLLRTEVANVLVMSERRGRITTAEMAVSLVDFDLMAIRYEPAPEVTVLRDIMQLARTERLSVYDATYLELALRHSGVLLTTDAALAAAARRLGVEARP